MEALRIAVRDSTNQLSCCAITNINKGRTRDTRRRGSDVPTTSQSSTSSTNVQQKTTLLNTNSTLRRSCNVRDDLLQQTPVTNANVFRSIATSISKSQFLAFLLVFVLFCLARTAETAPTKASRTHSTDLDVAPELDAPSNNTSSQENHMLAARRPEPAVFDASAFVDEEDKIQLKSRRSAGTKGKGRKQKGGKKGGKRKGKKSKRPKKKKNDILSKQAEEEILNNKSHHKSRSRHGNNSPRRQRLYQKEGRSYHLAVLPNGKVVGEPSHNQSKYTILEIQSVKQRGVVTIKGAATGRYICVNKRGKVKAKKRYRSKQCNFTERILPNNQNTYQSMTKKCDNCYLSMKRNGRVPKIRRQNPNCPKTHFLPRFADEAPAYTPAELTVQVTGHLPSPTYSFGSPSAPSKVPTGATTRDTKKRPNGRRRNGKTGAVGGKPARGHSNGRQQAGGKRPQKELVRR